MTRHTRVSRRDFLASGAAAAACFAAAPARAQQDFPSKPVRLIVGFAPGGSTDTLARLIAPFLSDNLGKPVLIENRSGGNGNLAAETVVRAPADGHTLTLSNTSLIVSAPHAYPNMSVDPVRGLKHITMIAEGRHVMLCNPELAGRSLADIVAMSKAAPDRMIHASTGAGSTNSIGFELFQLRTGSRFKTVHYRGTGPIINDMLANQVHLTIASEAAAEPYIASGRLGAVMIMAKARVPHLPNVPSSAELGVLDVDRITFWNGLHAATDTPEPIVRRLEGAIRTILANPELRGKMENLRLSIVGDSPDQFTARVLADYALYGELFKAANIKIEQ